MSSAFAFGGVPCIMGIDEAGRGPVLGPMVYGSAWCPVSRADDLAKLGFADSKQLTADQRTSLLSALKACDYIGWIADIISPETLSAKMTRRYKYNLNAISHDSAIGMIQNALDQGVNLSHVYLDTVGDPGRYQQKLCGIFPSIQFTVSKKADSLFPVVSAASIVAKVTRDVCLEEWSFPEEIGAPAPFTRDFGSGYPGDERTKQWLNGHLDPVFGFPSIVRFSWSTCSRLLDESAVNVDWCDPDDEDDNEGGDASAGYGGFNKKPAAPKAPKQGTLSGFMTQSSGPAGSCRGARAESRYSFFKTNHLHQVVAANSPF